MNIFTRLQNSKAKQPAEEEAVIVYLDAQKLSDAIYEEHDLATLEGRLEEAIGEARVGEYDGNEFGSDVVTLYMYGPNADQLFEAVESTLRNYPLCAGARVVVRHGGPDSPERTLVLDT